jgi:hypothetical protein
MPTGQQIKVIHVAARQVGLDDAAYRLVLKNVTGKESSKDLDNRGIEDLLAVFEDLGWRDPGRAETYWRDKVSLRGRFAGARLVFRINELAPKQKYDLAGLCRKVSDDRTEFPRNLTPAEGMRLLVILQDVIERQKAKDGSGGSDEGANTAPAVALAGT